MGPGMCIKVGCGTLQFVHTRPMTRQRKCGGLAAINCAMICVIALLSFVFGLFAPVMDAPAQTGVAAFMSDECPMLSRHSGKTVPHGKHDCICILCVTGAVAGASGAGISVAIAPALSRGVPLRFVTGVNATNGPRWTANSPRGPPAA